MVSPMSASTSASASASGRGLHPRWRGRLEVVSNPAAPLHPVQHPGTPKASRRSTPKAAFSNLAVLGADVDLEDAELTVARSPHVADRCRHPVAVRPDQAPLAHAPHRRPDAEASIALMHGPGARTRWPSPRHGPGRVGKTRCSGGEVFVAPRSSPDGRGGLTNERRPDGPCTVASANAADDGGYARPTMPRNVWGNCQEVRQLPR